MGLENFKATLETESSKKGMGTKKLKDRMEAFQKLDGDRWIEGWDGLNR